MEDDSLQHCNHLGSACYPVKGMESVVATVSGYQGSERFNLIKLVDRTGANYVGNMTQSVTHLVCWRFEGRKYEFAVKLKIPIVNHCWIEECAKKGRRVSEEPYTYRSGQEMGPFVLDILLGIDQAKAQTKDLKNGKRPLLDAELEDSNDAVWKDSILLDEDLFPKKRQNNHDPSRLTEKTIKRNSSKGCPSSSRHDLQELSTAKIVELDEKCTPPNHTFEEIENLNDDIEELEHPNDLQNSHGRVAPSSSATSEKLHEAANPNSTEEDSSPPASRVSCVICLTDFSSTRGVLPCGHRFCFECIQKWRAVQMASSKKPSTCPILQTSSCEPSTCPLCNANFICIAKVEDATSSDQKIYSQSMPNDSLTTNVYILSDETPMRPTNLSAPFCSICLGREPVDLLVSCNCCSIRHVHTWCPDPPLFPWTCTHCKDLRMLLRLHNR